MTLYTAADILALMPKFGIDIRKVALQDTSYVVVDDSKADEFFYKLHQQVVNQLGEYATNRANCNKFSRGVQWVAIWANVNQTVKNTALAIAVYNYRKDDDGSGHSINFLVTKKKTGELSIVFYEPQTGERMNLSITERNNTMIVFL